MDDKYYKGKTFIVKAYNNSPDCVYIQSAILNGKKIDRAWITHEEIVNGGTLELEMGAKPNLQFGKKTLPPSGLR